MKRWRWLPVIVYLSLTILYLFAVPSGESPDEPSHLQCIEQVALLGRLPEVEPRPTGAWWSRTNAISGYLCHHLPLYYLLGGLTQQVMHQLTGAPLHFEFPPSYPDGPRPAMFQAISKTSFFRLTEPVTVLALRILSIALGLLTLWAAYRVSKAILPDNYTAGVMAATLVAGWPQFLYMSRAINNDVLATALAVIVLALILPVGQPRRLVLATLTACAAILTKINMLFTLGVIAMAYVIEWVVWRDRRAAYIRSGMISGLTVCSLITLIALQPTLRQHVVSDLFAFNAPNSAVLAPDYWLQWLNLTFSSGYARFGWMNVPAPDWQATVWWLFIGATGLSGASSVRRVAHGHEAVTRLVLIGGWLLAVLAAYVKLNLNRFQPQFRFMLTMLPILGALSAIGYSHWTRSTRRQQLALLALAFALAAVNLWIVFGLIVPTYLPVSN